MSRRVLLFVLLIGVSFGVLTTSCSRCKRAGRDGEATAMDSVAQAKARQDSIAKVLADSLQRVQDEENARAREAELEAQRQREALRFHVISGSFRNSGYASEFLAQERASYPEAKQFNSPNGFYLVSIGDFNSMQSAVAFINRLHAQQDEPQDLWVFEEGGIYDTRAYLESLHEEEYGLGD